LSTDPRNVWLVDRWLILATLLPSDDPTEIASPFDLKNGWAFERVRFEESTEVESVCATCGASTDLPDALRCACVGRAVE
jgi:hypothetical protein